MFLRFCCNFVLTILHLMFSLHLCLKLLKLTFLKFIDNLLNIRVSREHKFQLDTEQIVENVNLCSKIPKHMTFALGNERISYEDLVQIIVWTLPTGIPVLSFYDHKNGTSELCNEKTCVSNNVILHLSFSFTELNPDKLQDLFIEHYPQLHFHIKWGVSFSNNLEEESSKSKSTNNFVAECYETDIN